MFNYEKIDHGDGKCTGVSIENRNLAKGFLTLNFKDNEGRLLSVKLNSYTPINILVIYAPASATNRNTFIMNANNLINQNKIKHDIISGDFNTNHKCRSHYGMEIRKLIDELNLVDTGVKNNIATFPRSSKRLDRIYCNPNYTNYNNPLSERSFRPSFFTLLVLFPPELTDFLNDCSFLTMTVWLLSHLPFGAFYNERQGKYLIENYSVSPSIEVLLLLDGLSQNTSKEALLLGNPTTSEKELDEIVHITCHGVAHQKPLEKIHPRSVFEGLFKLAVDEDHPLGHLHAEEIAKLSLKADLVFMSACHLGRGNLKEEGSINPIWSFLGAGVKSTIASYWPLPEGDTNVKMVEIFKYYLGIDTHQLNEAKTLRKAVLMAMKTEWDKHRGTPLSRTVHFKVQKILKKSFYSLSFNVKLKFKSDNSFNQNIIIIERPAGLFLLVNSKFFKNFRIYPKTNLSLGFLKFCYNKENSDQIKGSASKIHIATDKIDEEFDTP
ncbi:hypothetical protein ACTFIZ_012924 [Dictyostelium cf. discoideum]